MVAASRVLSRTSIFALSLLLSASGCDGDKKSDAANSPKADAPADDAKPIVGKPVEGGEGPVAKKKADEEPTYSFKVQKDDKYKQGEQGVVILSLVPAKGWHLNLEYPTKVKLDASQGVGLAKNELKKEDASTFGEQGFEFGVNFTPTTAGEGQFTGKIKFAVCQEEACSPQSEEIAFAVTVN